MNKKFRTKSIKLIKTKLRLKDTAIVIAGKSKGQVGEVFFVDKKRGLIFLKGVNVKKRYVKTQEDPKGKLLDIESPIPISNVMYYDTRTKQRTRIQSKKNAQGKKVRHLVKLKKEA